MPQTNSYSMLCVGCNTTACWKVSNITFPSDHASLSFPISLHRRQKSDRIMARKGVMTTRWKIPRILPFPSFTSIFSLRFFSSSVSIVFASCCPSCRFYLPLEESHIHIFSLSLCLSLSLSFSLSLYMYIFLFFREHEIVLHEGTALVLRYRCCCWRFLSSILCIDSSLCTRVCASEISTWKFSWVGFLETVRVWLTIFLV